MTYAVTYDMLGPTKSIVAMGHFANQEDLRRGGG